MYLLSCNNCRSLERKLKWSLNQAHTIYLCESSCSSGIAREKSSNLMNLVCCNKGIIPNHMQLFPLSLMKLKSTEDRLCTISLIPVLSADFHVGVVFRLIWLFCTLHCVSGHENNLRVKSFTVPILKRWGSNFVRNLCNTKKMRKMLKIMQVDISRKPLQFPRRKTTLRHSQSGRRRIYKHLVGNMACPSISGIIPCPVQILSNT